MISSKQKGFFALFAFILLCVPAGCHGQDVITTVAGNGIEGYSGDGGPASSAELDQPGAVAMDGSGNLYVTEASTCRIRMVNTSGVITTIAGNGTCGFSGDGGPATSAELNDPVAITADGAGNLYIADYNNDRIREVDTAGIISTVVGNGIAGSSGDGGPATSAELSEPRGVAVDGAGNLYIADALNCRIRMVNTSGVITTVAGNGIFGFSGDGGPATNAMLGVPYGIAVDTSGNLYIADTLNSRIREVNAAGIINTIAGDGINGFSGDSGPANNAELYASQIAIDVAGNLYMADGFNDRIREVNTSGIITTVAGNGNLGFSGDGGPAISAKLDGPSSVALDSAGNLYIADSVNNRIREISAILASPTSVSFAAALGSGNPSSQIINVSNAGGGTLSWTATASTSPVGNWLSISPSSGTNNGTVTVSVNTAGLSVGTYSGAITISATENGASMAQTINVALNVISQGVFNGGMVNAASFAQGLAVAPGSIVAVFGAQLASQVGSASAIPLTDNLAGASATINWSALPTIGPGGSTPAPLFFAAPGQINVQIPWQLVAINDDVLPYGTLPPLGELIDTEQATLLVTVNGTQLPGIPIQVVPAAPGIFTVNSQGTGQGAIIDDGPVAQAGAFAAPAGSVPGAMAQPAAPGDFVTIYCTGLGAVEGPPATGSAASSDSSLNSTLNSPVVTIGGIPAEVTFSGLVPTLVGEDQINVQVPANAPAGNAVPVSISFRGITSNIATMAIQ